MSSLHASLFGQPQLKCDGGVLHIPRRKTVALLAYLLVTNRPHNRESLIALFWPEDDPTTARANLRRALSELRQALGDEMIAADRAAVAFSPDATAYLDVADFKDSVAKVRNHAHQALASCEGCLAALEKAVVLYSGDFMAGFTLPDSPAFDEWQFFEGESLRQSLAQSLENLAAASADQRAYEQAIEHSRRWLALDPLHEPAHRQLMHLYVAAGRKEAALRQYGECARVLKEELGVEPEPATSDLYQAIRSGQLAGAIAGRGAEEPPGIPPDPETKTTTKDRLRGFPLTTTPLVGREGELSRLKGLLGSEGSCRLLTLSGPGGSGKTRLAIETAAILGADTSCPYTDGIWFISLAAIGGPGEVVAKIAQGVGLSTPQDGSLFAQNLVQFLRQKRILLVLDNFDEYIDKESVGLLLDILAAAPQVKILITSRARLDCKDEQVLAVGGLDTPPEDGQHELTAGAEGYDAVQMFRRCALRVTPGFELDAENLPDVVRICRLVQGMPLAIELAAAWIEVLSPFEIAEEIGRSLDFLEARWQGVPGRQRSLRAVFESSWSLLSEAERPALMALTVFQADFSRHAAQAVAGISLKSLLALVHKSWLGHNARGRFTIHELLCQYANEKLNEDPHAYGQVMDSLCQYYASFLQKQGQAMRGPGQREATASIEEEFGNVRKAWDWMVTRGNVEPLVDHWLPALCPFAEARFRGGELRQMLTQALSVLTPVAADPAACRARAILTTVRTAFSPAGFPLVNNVAGTQADFERDHWPMANPEAGVIREAWSLAGEPSELLSLGAWGVYLSYLYGRLVDPRAGLGALQFLAAGLRKQGLLWESAVALSSLGTLLDASAGQPGIDQEMLYESEQHLAAALAVFQELGDSRHSGFTLRSLGRRRRWRREPEEAVRYWQAATEALLRSGDRHVAAAVRLLLAGAYMDLCDYEAWLRCCKASIEDYLELGHFWMASAAMSWASLDLARYGDLGQAHQLREQSLAIRIDKDREILDPWHIWEMGELYRLEGNAPAARLWYDRAGALFRSTSDETWRAFYPRGLGDLAQAAGHFEKARRYFEESADLAVDTKHDWAEAYALAGLGRAETSLKQYDLAREHFEQAYHKAARSPYLGLMLVALSGLAALHQVTGERGRALALAGLVVTHKGTWNETREQAKQVLRASGIALRELEGQVPQIGCGTEALAEAVRSIEPALRDR